MHVSYGLHNLRRGYLFSIWIGSFESRHFTLYRYIFHVCKASIHGVSDFCAQVYRDRDSRFCAFCMVSLFFKRAMFCCYCECTQINVESLQILKMYYSYLYDQKSLMNDRWAFGCPARCTVLPQRQAVNDLSVTDYVIFSTSCRFKKKKQFCTKRLLKCCSTKPLLID